MTEQSEGKLQGAVTASMVSASVKPRRRSTRPDDSLNGVVMAAGYEMHPRTPQKIANRTGTVNLNQSGFGFVTEADGESFYIRAPMARSLLSGDEITFSVADNTTKPEVQRIGLINRASSILMAEVRRTPLGLAVISDDPCFVPLHLSDDEMALVAEGEVLAVRIPEYRDSPSLAPLKVTIHARMGPRKDEVEFYSEYARVKYGFDKAHPISMVPEHVLERGQPAMGLGVDTTPYVTIDGASTQDFDDAIFARKRSDGTWTVRVAISDVSHFVDPSSDLDKWAAQQATSVYLPCGHVPMLPPELSIGLCSLREGEIRRAVVMSLHLSAEGEVIESRVERKQVKSHARLTYAQVSKFLGGKAGLRFAGEIEAVITALEDVYKLLASRRRQEGVLDIEEPDPQLVKDENGVWKLVWESRTVAHKVVEEFMLLANRVAADMLVSRYGAGLFRHQPDPEPKAWEDLREWAHQRGHAMPVEPSLKAIVSLVNAQAEHGADAQLNAFFKVRTVMKPARYVVQTADQPGGHFSLSMDWYTHFTSPIRRYADLLVHRLLLAPDDMALGSVELEQLTAQVAVCSELSQRARLAERSVWDRLKLKCLSDSVSKTEVLRGRVLRSTPRGARLLIAGWQCSAWLLADALREKGFTFEDGAWTNPALPPADGVVKEGTTLSVTWAEISKLLPAYPELHVVL
ncbi:RNB domain-containing ribonuclease [Comamonas thiooxydans]|uniref:RNB domain-containing ribonuclease n=1 Tax=Comamonas thiooxydans TaxID=363952 RepID=UPI001555E9F4|nr:RNB domain-containing ribonuclease [Comamonas thiooxydans]